MICIREVLSLIFLLILFFMSLIFFVQTKIFAYGLALFFATFWIFVLAYKVYKLYKKKTE